MMVPVLDGMMDTEQLDVVALTVVKLHGVPVKLPVAVPTLANATVPPGALVVPDLVSLTNAVQLIDCATTTVNGEQDTTVVVPAVPTVTVLLVPVLVV